MEDDFGFDSADEADLLEAVESAAPVTKRAIDDDSNDVEPPTAKRHKADPKISALARRVLQDRFGLKSFRLEQEAAINRVIDGHSTVVVFPTGGGKSLCYQVPAVAIKELDRLNGSRSPEDGGVTVVISPLIALMKDQVDTLRRRGISAAVLDSTQTRDEFVDVYQKLSCGKLDLLYCAPERLNNEGFLASLQSIRGGIRLLAIDEAHCISEWGHSFRPDYLKSEPRILHGLHTSGTDTSHPVARFSKAANVERVVCLTATATAAVADDIRKTFDIPPEGLFSTSMHRPNLRLCVQAISEDDDQEKLCSAFLKENPGPSIIYVTTHAAAEQLAKSLAKIKFKAEAYHAGMKPEVRTDVQERFLKSKDMIIVGTIAFGMGIDKENVRTIVHFDLPSSIEAYSQQIGRAGRDGLSSTCMLYLSNKDFFLRNILIHGERPSVMALRALFAEICSPENRRLFSGDTFSVPLAAQSKRVDIKETQLSIIYAYLELKFGFLRASTPQYSEYKYQVLDRTAYAQDKTRAAQAISQGASAAKIWTHIDIDTVSDSADLGRAEITRKLEAWAEAGVIKLQKTGVQRIFRLSRSLPAQDEEIEKMIEDIDSEIAKREKQDLQRVRDLVNLLTGKACITRGLAAYFSDTTQSSTTECGHCTWCETHKQVVLPEFKPEPLNKDTMRKVVSACKAACSKQAARAKSQSAATKKTKKGDATDAASRQALANSTADKDARFLACVAFGIKTPRISGMALHNDKAVFEQMNRCDFDVSGRNSGRITLVTSDADDIKELVRAFQEMI
ncbi:ATP-dependent DNA helicase [Colletotrichum sojae]|uniref:ATP-dependent DNA helicase n=1 Tax=Colletotrichum sojae TaxID=2175907 RepID=A0A8H6JD11_9PEZI|nr:ATP-dependent DNA helicase [Colletotrichum sojae]